MERLNGFIDIGKILNIPNGKYLESPETFQKLGFLLIENPTAVISKYKPGIQLMFRFEYNNEIYYFKYDCLSNPYNELFVEEICKKLGIKSVSYDLAVIGDIKGVVSKNFKKKDAKYVLGQNILEEYLTKHYGEVEFKDKYFILRHNTLETIWYAFEERYKNKDVVAELMDQIIKMFIVDIITGQRDRHFNNWMIVEEDDIYLQPIFDNSRIYTNDPYIAKTALFALEKDRLYSPFWEESITDFLNVSSSEFIEQLKFALNILDTREIEDIFEKIKNKTGVEVPQDIEERLKEQTQMQKLFLEEILEDYKRR